MLKLTLEHVAAVSRAERDMQTFVVPNMSPHYRKFIEDDIERLAQIKRYLLKAIYEPGLPRADDPAEESESNGDPS